MRSFLDLCWKIGLVIILMLVAIVFLSGCARAAPPPVGSDDWKIMHPYAVWAENQHDGLGRWCCTIADGRPVEARIVGGDHWEVHIVPKQWSDDNSTRPGPSVNGGLTDHWMVVPDDKITRRANPTGHPVLWMYQGRVQCFAEPDGF